jgi:hypothetical protein
MPACRLIKTLRPIMTIALVAVLSSLFSSPARANPYLAKPGETPIRLRIATCAVSGGFVHLYNAFAAHLEKSGFLKELWGAELSAAGR